MNIVNGITNLLGSLFQKGQEASPMKDKNLVDVTVKTLRNIGKFFNQANTLLDTAGEDLKISKFTNILKPLNIDELFTSSAEVISHAHTAYKTSKITKKLKNSEINENSLDAMDSKIKDLINKDQLIENIKDLGNKLKAENLTQDEKDQLHNEKMRLIQELKNRIDLIQKESIEQTILHSLNGLATGIIASATIASIVNPKLLTVTPLVIMGAGFAKKMIHKELKTAAV